MRTFYKFIFATAILSAFSTSCSKEKDRKGCTDNAALNYNYLAVEDDGSCEYLDSSFTIYENDELSFLGDPTTGAFEARSCATGVIDFILNPDTTFTPADTTIDNNVTPADTTITPADTTISGTNYLTVSSDANGNYNLIIRRLNKFNASDFLNGNLVFTARLHPDANIQDYEVIIHGNHYFTGGIHCGDFHFSDPVVTSTATLDTNSFKEISIPISSFSNKQVNNIDLVFGIKGSNAPANKPLIMISNIRWEIKKPD
ncbi:MAG: hypothetical protein P8Q14_09675 [Vicingaceae bacterium]|nr:hypothetical protein [Vicingaceae bacterium]